MNESAQTPPPDRLSRVEDALAALQDTRQMEERLVSRLLDRLGPALSAHNGTPALPAMPTSIEPPPSRFSLPPGAATLFSAAKVADAVKTWSLVEFLGELRAMLAMFFDFRFRVSWLARLAPIIAIGIALLSWFFLSSSIPGLGLTLAILDKCVDAVLGVVVYKVLSREAARYKHEVATHPYYRLNR